MSDPLTQIGVLLQSRAVLMTEIHASGEWGIDFPAFRVTNFAIVAEGECWLRLGNEAPRPFRRGDFLLQPESVEFGFSSEPGVPTVFGDSAFKAAAGRIIRLGDGEGPTTKIVGGHFEVDRTNTDLFASLLPQAVHVPAGAPGADRLGNLLRLIEDEARENRPGRTMVLQRLAEVMVVEALRRPVPTHVQASSGLLAGLANGQLALALEAIHAEVAHDWTLPKLAAIAGMSRSAFARCFTDTVGTAPMTYVLRWRMALAKAALLNEHLTLDEIADRVGYGSAGAFSHAFLRVIGCTPSIFRRGG
jgi:AraC-like DNA-binding protein